MKTALALAYFFGSVLAAVGALWLGFSLAPPEYTPDGRALAVEAGRLAFKAGRIPRRLYAKASSPEKDF